MKYKPDLLEALPAIIIFAWLWLLLLLLIYHYRP